MQGFEGIKPSLKQVENVVVYIKKTGNRIIII